MYYCEACRIINDWPKGIGRSFGKCEVCNITSPCYDRPSSSLQTLLTAKRISLLPLDSEKHADFKLSDLIGPRQFCVKQIVTRSPRRVVIDYHIGDVADPNSDPIIIGSIVSDGEYSVRVLWDNRLWRPWDRETDEFMDAIYNNIKKT